MNNITSINLTDAQAKWVEQQKATVEFFSFSALMRELLNQFIVKRGVN